LSCNFSSKGGYWLYFADAWHPQWVATVNGQKTPVLRANLAFKAIQVPAGKSTILFEYSDPLLRWTLRITLIALAGFMLAVLWSTARIIWNNQSQ